MPQSPLLADVFIDDTTGNRVAPKVDHATGAVLTKPVAGAGEAVSIADGSDVAQGAVADAAYTTGSGTVISLLKGLFAKLASIVTNTTAFSAYNNAANTAGVQVKSGAGVLGGISVNTAGLTSSATLYDGTNTSGTKLGTFSTLAQVSLPLNLAFATGLFVVLAGGTPADVTIAYK